MAEDLVERINALARKSKSVGLTEEEVILQKKLREEYLAGFRKNLAQMLDNTYIREPDGTEHKLERKKP